MHENKILQFISRLKPEEWNIVTLPDLILMGFDPGRLGFYDEHFDYSKDIELMLDSHSDFHQFPNPDYNFIICNLKVDGKRLNVDPDYLYLTCNSGYATDLFSSLWFLNIAADMILSMEI